MLFASPQQTGASGSKKFLLTLAADADRYNLATALTAAGWNGTSPVDVTVTIPADRKVWSSVKTTPAFLVPAAIPAGSRIRVVNAGLICGKGDYGPAGDALKVERACTVDNLGSINGGGLRQNGFAGTSGYYAYWQTGGGTDDGGQSGCDAPCQGGTGGVGYGYGDISAGSAATMGATGATGWGGYDQGYGCPGCPGGAGGVGGGPGTSGKAVVGNALINWIATGTRNGALV